MTIVLDTSDKQVIALNNNKKVKVKTCDMVIVRNKAYGYYLKNGRIHYFDLNIK